MKSRPSSVIKVSSREASLKRKVRQHLRTLGFRRSKQGILEIVGRNKDLIRATHGLQRQDRLTVNEKFLSQRAPTLYRYFASGCEVNPEAINPILERD